MIIPDGRNISSSSLCTHASRVESKSFVYQERERESWEDNNSPVLVCLDMPGAEITSSHYPAHHLITHHQHPLIQPHIAIVRGKPVPLLNTSARLPGALKLENFASYKKLEKIKPNSLHDV